MKHIRHTDLPRWYGLYWDFGTNTLRLKIRRWFVENAEHKDAERMFELVRKQYANVEQDRCQSVIGQDTFGFNDSIVLDSQDENWLTYTVTIPVVRHQTDKPCRYCERSEGNCYPCGNTGKEYEYRNGAVNRVCSSLRILLFMLSIYDKLEVPALASGELQLFTLDIVADPSRGYGNHSIGGCMSPALVRFTLSKATGEKSWAPLESSVEAMRTAVKAMGLPAYDLERIRGRISDGRFCFDCEGDACFVCTDSGRRLAPTEGAEIYCHNVDRATQQLTLLVGIAAMATLYDTTC